MFANQSIDVDAIDSRQTAICVITSSQETELDKSDIGMVMSFGFIAIKSS